MTFEISKCTHKDEVIDLLTSPSWEVGTSFSTHPTKPLGIVTFTPFNLRPLKVAVLTGVSSSLHLLVDNRMLSLLSLITGAK